MADADSEARRVAYYAKVIGDGKAQLTVYNEGKEDKEAARSRLSEESGRLSDLVAGQSGSIPLTKKCSRLLAEARGQLTKPATQFDSGVVVNKLEEVKQLLLRAYESRESWKTCIFITIYNLGLLGAMCWLIFAWKDLVPFQEHLTNPWYVFLACVLWGGVGGIVDALISIYTHFSAQEFDKRYWPWYLYHPILGFSLGAIVFLLLQAGLLTLGGSTLKEATADGGGQSGITAFPIGLSLLAGFKQNTVWEFLKRVVTSVFPATSSSDTTQP